MSSIEAITLRPIGFVQTTAIGNEIKDKRHVSKIVLQPKFTTALHGLEDFSHIFVLFWMDQIHFIEERLHVHPRGRRDSPLLGIFATRTPHRPNPLGLTLVEIVSIDQNIITVRGLDAFNGTPILDIKPFDYWDSVKDATVPDWWKKLETPSDNL